MTKINVTKGQLLNKHQEISNWGTHGSILNLFLESKIKDFYNNNRIRINILIEELNDLKRTYFEFEDDGVKIKTIDGVRVMNEGFTIEDYNLAEKDLISQETVMVI